MTFDLSQARIYIRPGRTDLRKAANGLTSLIQGEMEKDPLSGSVFLFCNRDRRLLKGIWWDKTGFWLCHRTKGPQRLEKDKFPWPGNEAEVEELSAEELRMLLAGIDFWKAHRTAGPQPLFYSKVS
jgi:transposase